MTQTLRILENRIPAMSLNARPPYRLMLRVGIMLGLMLSVILFGPATGWAQAKKGATTGSGATKGAARSAAAKGGKAGYSIKARIEGIRDADCYLAYHMGDKQYLADTARAGADGWMEFTGPEPLDGGIYMVVLPSKRYFEILVNEQFFTLQTDSADLVGKLRFEGSRENTAFLQYLAYVNTKGTEMERIQQSLKTNRSNPDSVNRLRARYRVLDEEIATERRRIADGNPGTFLASLLRSLTEVKRPEPPLASNGRPDSIYRFYDMRAHYFDNLDMSDARMLRTPILHGKVKYYLDNLYPQEPDSLIAGIDRVMVRGRQNKDVFRYLLWYMSNTYENNKYMGMDAVFVHVASKYYLSKEVDWLDSSARERIRDRVSILAPLLLGKPAPRLVMQDSAGRDVPLYGVKSDYTVVIFYDPNCGHCQKELPDLNKVYTDTLRAKNVSVYAACAERDPKAWKAFIRKHQLKYLNVFDRDTVVDFRKKWDVYSFPTLYVLDRDKKIVAKRVGIHDLSGLVDQLNRIEAQRTGTPDAKNRPAPNNGSQSGVRGGRAGQP